MHIAHGGMWLKFTWHILLSLVHMYLLIIGTIKYLYSYTSSTVFNAKKNARDRVLPGGGGTLIEF